MLSGISHDLRTPITRIKLQIALINDKKIASELSEDVVEMEKMLNAYLQFAKDGAEEKTQKFNVNNLIKETIYRYDNPYISFKNSKEIFFEGRKELLKRSITNFIDNSLKYGKYITIRTKIMRSSLVIDISDDGIGIAKKEYENVFKPFYKIDKSRSESKSSVGLGMSISSDIIKSHGGKINLGKSEMGGLKVTISLPV